MTIETRDARAASACEKSDVTTVIIGLPHISNSAGVIRVILQGISEVQRTAIMHGLRESEGCDDVTVDMPIQASLRPSADWLRSCQ